MNGAPRWFELYSHDTPQASAAQQSNGARGAEGLQACRVASTRLRELADSLDDDTVRAASTLPGWSRKQVLSHIARGADALVNLLTWARTGVEQPLYSSRESRDADIEAGARLSSDALLRDVNASEERFFAAGAGLTDDGWSFELPSPLGPISAATLPWGRLTELLVHIVDLEMGVTWDDVAALAGSHLESLIGYVVWRADATGAGPLRLEVELPEGRVARWATGADAAPIHGDPGAMLAWLTGRSDGHALTGPTSRLPAWP